MVDPPAAADVPVDGDDADDDEPTADDEPDELDEQAASRPTAATAAAIATGAAQRRGPRMFLGTENTNSPFTAASGRTALLSTGHHVIRERAAIRLDLRGNT
jgi:hypothetical protein